MKKETLNKAINNIDNDLVNKAINYNKKKGSSRLLKAGCIAAAFLIVMSSVLFVGKTKLPSQSNSLIFTKTHAVSTAVYPKAAPCPRFDNNYSESAYENWAKDRIERFDARNALNDLNDFYKKTSKEFLSDSSDKNLIYSPVNLYMALSMLAEISDSTCRTQIFSLLGVSSIEELRAQAENLWKANYRDDGLSTTILANSVWLNENISYNKDTLDTLAEKYFASSFSGDVSSEEMSKLLRNWLNEQTGGLLKNYVKDIKLDPQTVISLCSTIYFNAKWNDEFQKSNNTEKDFHSSAGDIKAEFMNSDNEKLYFWGEDYGAVNLNFESGGSMWLILPNEDKTVSDVIEKNEYMDMISAGYNWIKQKNIIVHLSVPKFDVNSDTNLIDGLKSLGVTDVFDNDKSDFSPLLNKKSNVYISKAEHAARVIIDEKGCTAAAFTFIDGVGGAMPPEDEIDFVLDRPFIFVVQSDSSQPLFVGVVNTP